MPRHLHVIPLQCPKGHIYGPGSFNVVWDQCPCTAPSRGHHLITCLICLADALPPCINVPDCQYLDLLPGTGQDLIKAKAQVSAGAFRSA